jgi:hypothetical protein
MESLLLSRRALPSPTMCRFIPALSVPETFRREYLAAGETETELASIRQCTLTGRPLGTQEFVHALEQLTDRRLVP